MGNIKKVLAQTQLEPRSVTPTGLWIDMDENIHLHFRNFRLEMSVSEWAMWSAAMRNLYKATEHQMEVWDYEEGDPNLHKQLMWQTPLSKDSDYWPNRAVLEWERDGTYHLHYRDLRLHMTEDEFEDIANMFIKGKALRDEHVDFAEKYALNGLSETKRMTVSIDDVQPYDAGHKAGGVCFDPEKEDATRDHEEGIEKCMEAIQTGKKILPILVAKDGQRLDGFKRYMAFKRLGHKEIEVIVDPEASMGGQHGMSWIEEEECVSS